MAGTALLGRLTWRLGNIVEVVAETPRVKTIALHVPSRTVKDLVAGSGIGFTDRGIHRLKGVPDEWQLFAVEA
jgi:hypothetical protein